MNFFSLGLAPSRSVQLGLRAICHSSARTPLGPGAARFLSICSRSPHKSCSSQTSRPSWPPRHDVLHHHRASRRWYASRRIISQYEDLPPNYDDKVGLDFSKFDLETPDVIAIFGPKMSPAAANQLLKIMHGRRVAGTLKDPEFFPNTSKFTKYQKQKALEYLRKTVPADEVMNAGLRAENELKALEEKMGKEADGEKKKPVYTPHPVYGRSVLDEIRANNEAKWEEEKKRREEEKRIKELAEPGPLAVRDTAPARQISPRMQKWIENATSKIEEVPEMTHAERILPSATVVLLFVGLCAALAMVYTPPREADRLFPEVSASRATISALIAVNLLVWAVWRIPPAWGFMNKYFLLVHGLPRPVTMLTSIFSHSTPGHLASNMIGLWIFGTLLHDDIGRGNFLAIYLASGALGFLGSLTALTLRGSLWHSTLGASGAVYGITTAYFWLHRFDSFRILGLPREPSEGPKGIIFLSLILALHLSMLLIARRTTVDLWSHMTGMAAGAAGVGLVQRRRKGGVAEGEKTVELGTTTGEPEETE